MNFISDLRLNYYSKSHMLILLKLDYLFKLLCYLII